MSLRVNLFVLSGFRDDVIAGPWPLRDGAPYTFDV